MRQTSTGRTARAGRAARRTGRAVQRTGQAVRRAGQAVRRTAHTVRAVRTGPNARTGPAAWTGPGARTVRTGRALRAAALAAALGLMVLAPAPPGAPATAPAAASAPSAPPEGADPVDFAIVVDQSDSLSDEDLAREVEAASLLAQGEISERSRATVIGFGSSEKPGQSPVREVCPLTVADAAGRQRLSDCVQQLGRRDQARVGPGTDFPAAVRQAVTRLTERDQPATPKVVFLLTDGRLDVEDSPEYGTDRESRKANGVKRLADELARARRENVQIWPLGFGTGIDRATLTAMAEGGYRGGCADRPSATPRMRVVADSTGIDKAFQETFAAARCAGITPGDSKRPPADLYVTIPPIATDGSITVSKHDPEVTVTYYDPRGRKVPTSGTFDGSGFELSGRDGPVEALRVSDPLPGRWRARVEAPEGHRGREVAVRAIWQGRLRSSVVLDPASPRPGERAVVEVRMQTRRGVYITDPALLTGIKVTGQLAGDGFDPVGFTLADDGRAPDRTASDVRFTGTVTVPAGATGALRLTTRMEAPGVTSDLRPLNARTGERAPAVVAGLTVDRTTVHPGDTVRGTLSVTNNDSAPHTLRLTLSDQAPGTELRVDPAAVTVPPGSRRETPFTLTVGAGTALGEIGGKITAVDAGAPDRPLTEAFLVVRVEERPGWPERWWPALAAGAAAVLLLGAFAALRLRAVRARLDLTGVELELLRDGHVLDRLTVRHGQSVRGRFPFTVEQGLGTAPTLQRGRPGAHGAHELIATRGGELRLRPHGGPELPVRDGAAAGLDDGLDVAVHDRRSAGRAPGGRTDGGRTDGGGLRGDRGTDPYGTDPYGTGDHRTDPYGSGDHGAGDHRAGGRYRPGGGGAPRGSWRDRLRLGRTAPPPRRPADDEPGGWSRDDRDHRDDRSRHGRRDGGTNGPGGPRGTGGEGGTDGGHDDRRTGAGSWDPNF
ncbi:VWA domain-containing protein [Streptomyces fradiae]|uniref:VWA domain-containing protein n=1 Tax=Streptomyces fradiae TaxID=1906 RepID=UPI0033C9FA54